jgi:flagellar basal body P-ring formation protein FlgA
MFHLLLLAATTSAAFEDLELLDDRIWAVSPHAAATDKRLKLAECPDDPIIAPAVGGTVVVRCPALGWRLRVPVKIPAATAESAEMVVRKGDLVECISGGPGFSVSTMMVALDNAAAGQPVRVKSLTSPVAITATAKARGLVSF